MSRLEFDKLSVRALENCSYCPRLCHFACPTAHGEASETASAWGMMSVVNMIRKGAIEPDPAAIRDIYRCTSCGRCTEFCRHRNPVADVLESAREQLMPEGFEPLELVELRGISRRGGAPFDIGEDVRSLVETHSKAPAGFGYFPGCGALRYKSDRIERTLELLGRIAGAEFTLAVEADALCCGGWAGRAGLRTQSDDARERVHANASKFHTVVSGCTGLEEREGGPRIVPLVEYLASRREVLTEITSGRPPRAVTLHGGCRERRPSSLADAEASVLAAIGVQHVPAHALNGEPECCGGDAVYSAISPRGSARAAEAVVAGSRTTDSELVTSSDRCARHMSQNSKETVLSVLGMVLERCSTQA